MKKTILISFLATSFVPHAFAINILNIPVASSIATTVAATALDYYKNSNSLKKSVDIDRFDRCLGCVIDPIKHPQLYKFISTSTRNFCLVGIPTAILSAGLSHLDAQASKALPTKKLSQEIIAALPDAQTIKNIEQKYGPFLAAAAENFFGLCLGIAHSVTAGGLAAMHQATSRK